jgi:WD40 repeat protein/Ca2+-binding EF-hand superfamily protein
MTDLVPSASSDQSNISLDNNALNLRWCFGFNSCLLNSVANLSTANRNASFYVSAHSGVIHDHEYDTQYLLQGHCNSISAVSLSKDKRWIATADNGADSMIIIWDSIKAAPVKILPLTGSSSPSGASNSPVQGVIAMDLSSDSMFLACLTASQPQQLLIYEWPTSSSQPVASILIDSPDFFHCVQFNPVDCRDLIINSPNSVIFYRWTERDELIPSVPAKGISKLRKTLRKLTRSTFIPYTTKAVTATSTGHIVAWDYPASDLSHSAAAAAHSRDAIKILKLVKCGISVLETVAEKYLVCGCEDGAIRFFDFQFRVVAWYEEINAGPIISLSFAANSASNQGPNSANQALSSPEKGQFNVNSISSSMEEFSVPQFLVATAQGKLISLENSDSEAQKAEKRRGKLLVNGFDNNITCLAAFPNNSYFAAASNSGEILLFDLDDRSIVASRRFFSGEAAKEGQFHAHSANLPKKQVNSSQKSTKDEIVNHSNVISAINFSPSGEILAVGFASGFLKLVSASETSYFTDLANFSRSSSSITHLAFSPDNLFLAVADAESCVGLYRYYYRDEEKEKSVEWIYIGKYRAHLSPIVNIFWENHANSSLNIVNSSSTARLDPEKSLLHALNTLETNKSYPRLFSLAQDRILQEFFIEKATIRAGLAIRNSTEIEQISAPTASLARKNEITGKNQLFTANKEYKIKIWSETIVNSAQNHEDAEEEGKLVKQCERTVLGPTYGEPLSQLFSLPQREGTQMLTQTSPFLVYSTENQLIGLIKLPLDGNPLKSMALLAHPGEISSVICSWDGKYIITAGRNDRAINLWSVSTAALDATIALGGQGISPYTNLLEGGASGPLFNQLLDFFYYSQLKTQGLDSTKPRKITGRIPTSEAIELMRALGFYPTEKQIENIIFEVKSDQNGAQGAEKGQISLEQFIKLYINHRPVAGIGSGEIEAAFSTLGGQESLQIHDDGEALSQFSSLDSEELVQKLLHMGETMSEQELLGCLSALVPEENKPQPQEQYDTQHRSDLSQRIKKVLSYFTQNCSAKDFAEKILGFDNYGPQRESAAEILQGKEGKGEASSNRSVITTAR